MVVLAAVGAGFTIAVAVPEGGGFMAEVTAAADTGTVAEGGSTSIGGRVLLAGEPFETVPGPDVVCPPAIGMLLIGVSYGAVGY